jgi:hypothetical protein
MQTSKVGSANADELQFLIVKQDHDVLLQP